MLWFVDTKKQVRRQQRNTLEQRLVVKETTVDRYEHKTAALCCQAVRHREIRSGELTFFDIAAA